MARAPRCSSPGPSCDSGTLLNGRDGKGPEANQPNTLTAACGDGTSGTYHVDESNDRIRVLTLDGTNLSPGKTVRIEATVWAYAGLSADKLDLYYAATAFGPSWVHVATLTPAAAGAQTLSATYVLPEGSVQAVRPVFDATLLAPRCAAGGRSCDSGPNLLRGRNSLGPEPQQPNTVAASCPDGGSGRFHSDESNDRLKVSTVDGTLLAAGKAVRVEATVWAYREYVSDKLDLYYAADAGSPTWTHIATLTPTKAGAQTLGATYTLPTGAQQAVRARFRYGGSPASCGTGAYDDHDDLVFAAP